MGCFQCVEIRGQGVLLTPERDLNGSSVDLTCPCPVYKCPCNVTCTRDQMRNMLLQKAEEAEGVAADPCEGLDLNMILDLKTEQARIELAHREPLDLTTDEEGEMRFRNNLASLTGVGLVTDKYLNTATTIQRKCQTAYGPLSNRQKVSFTLLFNASHSILLTHSFLHCSSIPDWR